MDSDLLAPACAAVLDGWAPFVAVEQLGEVLEGYLLPPPDADTWRFVMVVAEGKWAKRRVRDEARILLDFTRAEVRDRVARVLYGGTRPERVGLSLAPGVRLYVGEHWWWTYSGPGYVGYRGSVPALASLDPHDDTRLPDGSRRVDALALRAVYMEVCCGE